MKKKIFKIKKIYKQNKLKNTCLYHGLWALKTKTHGIITEKQLESTRKIISWSTKKICKIWIRVQCNTPVTKKSIGTRMGKGVGSISYYICNVKAGTIIIEIFFNTLISTHVLKDLLIIASKKLSLSVKLVKKMNL